MKTINTFILFILMGLMSQITLAQQETRIGGLIAFGTEVESLGIGANAEFPIMDKLTVSPSFIFYFPKKSYGVKVNWFEVNANANYYFLENDKVDVYGLAGLNFSSVKVNYDGAYSGLIGSASASDGRFGLNIGAGANLSLGKSIIPFSEIKYVIIDGGQLVIAAGVKFGI